MKLTQLPKWRYLPKKDKERIKLVFKPRIKEDYNLDGSKSISKRELKRGVKK